MKKNPTEDHIPTWYELSISEDSKTIFLKIHRLAFEDMYKKITDQAPFLTIMRNLYGLEMFTHPWEGDCGFYGVLKFVPFSEQNWITWSFELPVLKAGPNSKKSPKNYSIALRVTLNIFFNCLWLFEGDTGHHTNQIMVVDSIVLPTGDRSYGQGGLSVTLTPDAIAWLSVQPEGQNLGFVVKAMKAAYQHIWFGDLNSAYRFGALVRRPKWINLCIPGNACDLDPESYNDLSLDYGYRLDPHNVDSDLQQFTFIAGLAKLHELIRQ